MEKNEFYVVVNNGRTEYHLSYSSNGYFAATCGLRANFETVEDAKRALAMVGTGSVALVSDTHILSDKDPYFRAARQATALPADARALAPEEIANERRFAAGPNRPADFASHEKEHENMKLPEMEQSLIAEFKARCELGFKQYGPVYLAKRNWGKEMKEEALDGLFYALMAAKSVEKYGAFIQALEEASDDDLSMDACSPDPLKQAAYLVKKYAADLSAMEEELNSALLKLTDAGCLARMRGATIVDMRKALEDEREAKRIAVRDADATIAGLCESRDTHLQNSEALMKELVESRKSGAAEFRRAQEAETESAALRVELSAALLRCSFLEAATARWKEDADKYFVESDERGRTLKEVTQERDYYKDSALCAREALARVMKEVEYLRDMTGFGNGSKDLQGRPR